MSLRLSFLKFFFKSFDEKGYFFFYIIHDLSVKGECLILLCFVFFLNLFIIFFAITVFLSVIILEFTLVPVFPH
jgi:hypothetical protein